MGSHFAEETIVELYSDDHKEAGYMVVFLGSLKWASLSACASRALTT